MSSRGDLRGWWEVEDGKMLVFMNEESGVVGGNRFIELEMELEFCERSSLKRSLKGLWVKMMLREKYVVSGERWSGVLGLDV